MSQIVRVVVVSLLLATAGVSDVPGQDQPKVYAIWGNPDQGRRIYAAKGCGRCHAINGVGPAIGPDLGRPAVRPQTITQLAGAMWNHAPDMRKLAQEKGVKVAGFKGSEFRDLIAYLHFLRKLDQPGDVGSPILWAEIMRLQERLTHASGRPLTRTNRVRVLRDGADTFIAMLELIEDAQTEILLENYIIRADAVGRAFGAALTTRAQAGLDVRILHDPFGDPLSLLALHLQFWRSPARLSVYNPPRPTPGYLRAWRDHRKLIVQDRTRLVAGGLCVADVWLGNCVRRCT